MSIAVTALIKPSRLLYLLMILMNGLVFISLIWSVFLVKTTQLYIVITILGIVWLYSFWKQKRYLQQIKMMQLDISSKGGLILRSVNTQQMLSQAERVELISGSVVWSFLMMLHLKSSQGQTIILPIFFDSVDKESFRRLSVALRWLIVRLDTKKH